MEDINKDCNKDHIFYNMDSQNNEPILSETIFKNICKYSHQEYQYLHLLKNILDNGVLENNIHNDTKTYNVFGKTIEFSLKNNTIPILTTYKINWKNCLNELLWIVRGETNNTILKKQGVNNLNIYGSRENLDSKHLNLYPVDILGPIDGYQWRYFNANYNCLNGLRLFNNNEPDIFSKRKDVVGIDQLQQIINILKDPVLRNTSQCLILTAWNPIQLDKMALFPRNILCQFNIHNENQLSCSIYTQSCNALDDISLTITTYGFLTHLIAKHCGLEAYKCIFFMGNCYMDDKNIVTANQIIKREPIIFPTILIKQIRVNINDYLLADFEINNYIHHE